MLVNLNSLRDGVAWESMSKKNLFCQEEIEMLRFAQKSLVSNTYPNRGRGGGQV